MNMFKRIGRMQATRILAMALTAGLLLSSVCFPAVAENDSSANKREIAELIANHHVSGIGEDQLDLDSIDTMIDSLHDPYTQYFSPEEWKQFMDTLENNYTGIGIRVGQDETGFFVNEVFQSTPAADAGLQDGDYIVEVEGNSVDGKTTEQLVSEITGPEGTPVRITVDREGKRLEFTLLRKEIHIPALTSRMLDPGIGYIRVSSFSSDADELFSEEVDRMKEQGLRTLVLDLRNNPGGLLETAGNMATRFIDDGNLIHTRDRSDTETPYPIKGVNPIDVPVIVLVNEYSASASEVLAGALQDYELATLIGRPTFGKGSVQSLYQLSGGGVLKLTVQEYLTPLKHPVNHVGLTPDIEVYGDAPQLITALQAAADIDIRIDWQSRGLTVNGLSFLDTFKVVRSGGMTYVPARILAAVVEGEASWDAASRSVLIHTGDRESAFAVNSEGVMIERGVSYIALNRFQTQYPTLAWSDKDGLLTIIENGRR